MTKPVLIFDVNETLLDMARLKASVANALQGREALVPLWFSTLLHYSLVSTLSGSFRDFGSLARACLQMVAEQNGQQLSEEAARNALAPMLSLPPHPEVEDALDTLRENGYRLAALTNSSVSAMEQQLESAGIRQYFEQAFSVEQIGLYKPHPQVYRWAAYQLQNPVEECMMIAAHAWDVSGAAAAGMQTAFIARPGQLQFPLLGDRTPGYADLTQFAKGILR